VGNAAHMMRSNRMRLSVQEWFCGTFRTHFQYQVNGAITKVVADGPVPLDIRTASSVNGREGISNTVGLDFGLDCRVLVNKVLHHFKGGSHQTRASVLGDPYRISG
jgi:hypothetical protein